MLTLCIVLSLYLEKQFKVKYSPFFQLFISDTCSFERQMNLKHLFSRYLLNFYVSCTLKSHIFCSKKDKWENALSVIIPES